MSESIDENDVFQKHLRRTLEYDRLVRSELLHKAIVIDGVIAKIIAWHFCHNENDHPLFFSVFDIGELSFSKKIRMLNKLLKFYYSDLHEKYSEELKKLDKFRELRNKFAHSELVLPTEPLPEILPDKIELRYLKDGKNVTESITIEDANKKVKEAFELWLRLLIIECGVSNQVTGRRDEKMQEAIKAMAEQNSNEQEQHGEHQES